MGSRFRQGISRISFLEGVLEVAKRTYSVLLWREVACGAMRGSQAQRGCRRDPRTMVEFIGYRPYPPSAEALLRFRLWQHSSHTAGRNAHCPGLPADDEQVLPAGGGVLCASKNIQKTFKERVLCPLAISQQDFMYFCTPLVAGNIIGNHITGHLIPCSGLVALIAIHHSFCPIPSVLSDL
jgi:hypothetical protein